MDHERRFDRGDKRTNPPSEGVRIIGAEEAAEALERGDVAQRRGDDQPRYGDRPAPPASDGPRPVLRFPLGSSSDPTDIARPPVAEPISEPVELPHWTQPPTGQVPQILPDPPAAQGDDLEDWASFATSAPRWRDDAGRETSGGGFDEAGWGDEGGSRLGALDDRERPTHDDFFSFADIDERPSRSVFADIEEDPAPVAPPPIDDEWDDQPGFLEEPEPYDDPPTRRVATGQRIGRASTGSHRATRSGGGAGGDRDLGQAAIVGVAFLAVAAILFRVGPNAAMLLVTAVIGLAAAELFTILRQAGYHPITLAGITGSVGLVLGAYNWGYEAVPTVLFLTTAVCLLTYLVGAATETPVMSIGVTLLGVLWVGLFGSFAGLMLSLQDPGLGILMAAILGTVGYDVGGLFIGKNAGRQPLSAVSPNKTVEGLVGGGVVAVLVVVIVSSVVGLGPIDSVPEGLLVGLAIAVAAPLGDLCQSLVKRDLGVKDMGSVLPGHGGLMDRFDGLLFVLPTVWLLAVYRDFFV
ncbi:MAG: phosphatidate cytidylyltransferase [Acidimicrobiales bacterium]|nr:phosphatidate cytidylyltransferase [Acidimicrobiales bacterium]